jgi:ATP-dependent RNA helicase RhlE
MKFESLNISAPILDALREQGYVSPTPIQEKAIPPALEGRDVLGCAQTGTGKTCAFAVPILQRLSGNQNPAHPIRALVLTPTRELAIQIQECFEAYGKHLPLRSTVIFGGVGQAPQVSALQKGTDVLVATPGRLQDLHDQGYIDVSHLEVLVLDEADRMLDMGFIHDVKRILAWLPQEKQTLFFSATMPKEITNLVNSLLKNPARVAVNPVSSPVDIIEQRLYFVDKNNKTALLADLLEEEQVSSAIVFTRTKHGANKVAGDLSKRGIQAAAIHGNKSQTARQNALSGFKDGSVRVLVATDIAARGLDIEELPYVFNYNLPEVPETYVHRIGRTGRAGHEGIAISFCDFGEKVMLKDIEKLLGRSIPVVADHAYPMVVLEAPKKDRHGRVVNEEDQEARAAAKERRRARDAANKAAAQEKKVKQNQAAAQSAQEEAQPKPAKNQKKKKSAPKQEVQTPAPKPEKKERTYTRPVRTGSLDDYLKDLPEDGESYDYSEFPLLAQWEKGGQQDKFVDATERMFATHSSRYRDAQEGGTAKKKGQRKGQKQGQKAEQPQEKPQKGQKSAKTGEKSPAAKKSGKKNSQKGGQKAKTPAAPPEGRLLQVQKKRRRRDNRPPAIQRSPRATQKDSTEQKSLMKPYYITKD